MSTTRDATGDIDLVETRVAAALRAGDTQALRVLLASHHPADLADVIDRLDRQDRLTIFALLAREQAAEVLDETRPEATRQILASVTPVEAGAILDLLPADDAAELLGEDAPERQQAILSEMAPGRVEDVRSLLTFPPQSAGRLMTTHFARVRAGMTAGEAIRSLHTVDPGVQTLDNLYAVGEDDTLLGMVPLRDVFRAAPERPVADLVQALPVTVSPQTDREEVARLVSHYDLSSIPVVDSAGRILGIVTVDDVIDVFADEFSEDYLRMAGTDAEEMARRTPVQVARLRLPWLLGTMAIELLAGLVIARFDDVLREVILLASFMPVISAVSGNAGLQAAAIVVRGLDTGHVSVKNWSRQLRKEMVTALVMALTCGVVLGAIGALWSQRLPFGVVIGVALAGAMLTAGFMGTVIPIVSKRLGFDPATTAGPFETAFQDVIGFAVFLWLASLLIDWLV